MTTEMDFQLLDILFVGNFKSKMPVRDDMELPEWPPPEHQHRLPKQHTHSDVVNSDSSLLGPKQAGRGKSKTRSRKRPANDSDNSSKDVPGPWEQSHQDVVEDRENCMLLQKYGTRAGLHLPNIRNRHGLANMSKNHHHKPLLALTKSSNPADVTLPVLPKSVTPLSGSQGGFIQQKSPKPSLSLPPAKSPRDSQNAKTAKDLRDPSRDYAENSRDNCGSPPKPLPPIPRIRMTTVQPSQQKKYDTKKAYLYLPPLVPHSKEDPPI